eukprot:267064-Rhodomonas_salina.1
MGSGSSTRLVDHFRSALKSDDVQVGMGASRAKACKGTFTADEIETIRLCSHARVAHQDASTCNRKLHARSTCNVGRAA